jgi:hypothetical protein
MFSAILFEDSSNARCGVGEIIGQEFANSFCNSAKLDRYVREMAHITLQKYMLTLSFPARWLSDTREAPADFSIFPLQR